MFHLHVKWIGAHIWLKRSAIDTTQETISLKTGTLEVVIIGILAQPDMFDVFMQNIFAKRTDGQHKKLCINFVQIASSSLLQNLRIIPNITVHHHNLTVMFIYLLIGQLYLKTKLTIVSSS